MSGSSQGARASLPGHGPSVAAPHQRAGNCRRRAAAPAVWVFILDAGQRERTRWYWARGGAEGERSDCGFPSFDACVADARGYGFDFGQPYHVTAAS